MCLMFATRPLVGPCRSRSAKPGGLLGALGLATIAGATADATTALAAPIQFEPPQQYELSGSLPHDRTLGDFNEDGRLDVAIAASNDGGEVSILLGDAAGGFLEIDQVTSGLLAWGVVCADFDADLHLDLAVTNGTGQANEVRIFHGDGNGNFAMGTTLTAGSFPIDLAVADFNRDGNTDLAVTNNVLYGLTIFLGDGSGQFSGPFHEQSIAWLMGRAIAAADLNHDENADIVVCSRDTTWLFLGRGDGSFEARGSLPIPGGTDLFLADLNGDTHPDIVSFNSETSVALGDGTGSFTFAWQSTRLGNLTSSGGVVDFNRDGRPDLVNIDDTRGALIYLGHGDGTFDAGQFVSFGVQPAVMAAADWKSDGWPDLFVADRNWGDTAIAFMLIQVPGALALEAPIPGLAGTQNLLRVTGATTAARAFVVGGVTPGAVPVPGCPGLTIEIASPRIVGSTLADPSGVAEITAFAPAALRGKTVLLQAVEPSTCRTSARREETLR